MSALLDSLLTRTQRAQADTADASQSTEKPAAVQIAELRLELARQRQRNADLLNELQLAVDEVCNEYAHRGHLARVRVLYGIEDRITGPDMTDTVRLAYMALMGNAPRMEAIRQCREAYRNATGLVLG